MRTAGQYNDRGAADATGDEFTSVADRGRWRPARNLRVRRFHTAVERICERAQAAPKDDAGHNNIPAMQADMKFAMVPQATAFIPSRARSDSRVYPALRI